MPIKGAKNAVGSRVSLKGLPPPRHSVFDSARLLVARATTFFNLYSHRSDNTMVRLGNPTRSIGASSSPRACHMLAGLRVVARSRFFVLLLRCVGFSRLYTMVSPPLENFSQEIFKDSFENSFKININ